MMTMLRAVVVALLLVAMLAIVTAGRAGAAAPYRIPARDADILEAIARDPVAVRLVEAIERTGATLELVRERNVGLVVTGTNQQSTVAGTSTGYECDGRRCAVVDVRVNVDVDLRSTEGRVTVRHELAHALVAARTSSIYLDNLGHPRPALFNDAWEVMQREGQPPDLMWFCYAAEQPLQYVEIGQNRSSAFAEATPRALAEWIACAVARTGEFR